jgi:hypothetical protein
VSKECCKCSEWREMYCVESHRIFIKGERYLIKRLTNYTAEVKVKGKIYYEDPRYFQVNKPIIRTEEDEEDYRDYEEFI